MKFRIILIIYLICYFAENILAQPFLPLNNDYNLYIENSVILNPKFHSAIRPYNFTELKFDTAKSKASVYYNLSEYKKKVSLSPLYESLFTGSFKSDYGINIAGGISFRAIFGKCWSFQMNILGNLSRFPDYITEKIDSNKIVPHYGRYSFLSSRYYGFPLITGFVQYSPKPYLTISSGIDKHFIGDGYRSMLLSDNAAPYPFAKLTVPVWRIKYIILWTFLKDIDSYSGNSNFHKKYAVIHFFSYNITERLNLGFFEAIVWRGSDTATNRGFDLNYLNPVIFFRPVEFSLHSPDNPNVGASVKLRFWKRTFLYGQLLIDDFALKRFLNGSGWWGNKYGIQAGIKCYNFAGYRNLYLQGEFNFARPFTYSHLSSLLNYGNVYQSIAHPLGANFWELVGITRYAYKRCLFSFKATGAIYGSDSSFTSYGQNIYKTYAMLNSYNNIYTGQGLRTKVLNIETKLNYSLIPKWNIFGMTGYRIIIRKNNIESRFNNYFFIGISTYLYNNDIDF